VLFVARQTQYYDYAQVQLSFPMINRLVELLIRENPAIRKALRLTYLIVFLDEFQDTTFAQFHLLEGAFHGTNAIFTAVGDNKQRYHEVGGRDAGCFWAVRAMVRDAQYLTNFQLAFACGSCPNLGPLSHAASSISSGNRFFAEHFLPISVSLFFIAPGKVSYCFCGSA
jgi:hypothetical protein